MCAMADPSNEVFLQKEIWGETKTSMKLSVVARHEFSQKKYR